MACHLTSPFQPLIFEKVAKVARVDVDFGSPASVTFSDRKDKGRVLVTIGGEIVPTDTDEIAIKLISGLNSL